jgi:hypothetical protein
MKPELENGLEALRKGDEGMARQRKATEITNS